MFSFLRIPTFGEGEGGSTRLGQNPQQKATLRRFPTKNTNDFIKCEIFAKSEISMSKTTFRRRATVCSKKIYRTRTMFKTIHKSLIKTLCFWKSGQFGRDWRLVRITPPVWLRTKSLDWANFEKTSKYIRGGRYLKQSTNKTVSYL